MKVRYYGHVGSLSGYGRAAADLCMALLSTGKVELEISPIDYRVDQARVALAGPREVLVSHCRRQDALTKPDVVIVHTLPGDAVKALWLAQEADAALDLVPAVLYTTWEGVTATPEVVCDYDDFAQLWTPSHQAMDAFMTADPLAMPPCHVMPHAFDPATLPERRLPRDEDAVGYRFYYVGAWNGRKNPAGLLRAWAHAFTADDEGVLLTLHCPGATSDQFAIAAHQSGLYMSDMAPIAFSNTHISEAEILRMHRNADCFVTASRGEAWNLPAFDAALAGRMVIAPRGHGSDEYLSKTSALRVRAMRTPAAVDIHATGAGNTLKMTSIGAQGLSARSLWLEPDLREIASGMRAVWTTKNRSIQLLEDQDFSRFSYADVGNRALAALKDLT